MQTNNMAQRRRRMTRTVPFSSWMVTAKGGAPLAGGFVAGAGASLAPKAASIVSRSVPLEWMAYKEAATVAWVRRVATGIGGLEA